MTNFVSNQLFKKKKNSLNFLASFESAIFFQVQSFPTMKFSSRSKVFPVLTLIKVGANNIDCIFAEKLGSDGRRGSLEGACSATQKALRLLDDSNGYQEKGNFRDTKEKNSHFIVNSENNEVNDSAKEKLTFSKSANPENSDILGRSYLGNGVRSEDENGTKFSRNKLWTNKVDGIARIRKGSLENEESEVCQPLESNVRTFFSNLLKFSLKKLYGAEDADVEEHSEEDGILEELNEGDMGNLQSGENRKSKDGGKSPAKKKGGFLLKKSPGKDAKVVVTPLGNEEPKPRSSNKSERVEKFLNICTEEEKKVVSPEGIVGAEDPTVTGPNGNVNSVELDPAQHTAVNMISDAKYISTDSWRQVQTFEINKERLALNFTALTPQSRESSSESVFTDPLTPRAFAELEVMKTEKTIESGSSTTSKTSNPSQRQDTDYEGTSSLEDITLIDDPLTDAEVEDSVTMIPDKERRKSDEASEADISIASAPCHRPTTFTLEKHKKVDLEPLPSKSIQNLLPTPD